MSKQEQTSPELQRRSRIIKIERGLGATLPRFVSQETLLSAGFNHYEATGNIEGRNSAIVYEGRLAQDHFVVIRNTRNQKDGMHVDWYFGAFKSRPKGYLKNYDEVKEYEKKIKDILTRSHRVPGYRLEDFLKQAVKKHLGID